MAMRKPDTTRPVIIHGIEDARLVCRIAAGVGRGVELRSAAGASANMGALWFREIIGLLRGEFPALEITGALDCGDAPGEVLGAIRSGITHLIFSGPTRTRKKLAQIASASGAMLVDRRRRAFDLSTSDNPEEDCRRWFGL